MRSFCRSALSAGLFGSFILIGNSRAAPASSPQLVLLDTSTTKAPAINRDFPDPSLLQDSDGTWYAFATTSGGKQVQVAKADAPGGPWTYINQDLLPNPGPWTSGENTWAPDVRMLGNGSYVMYYSGEVRNNTQFHCVGVATAKSVLGPWTAQSKALTCNTSIGGSIDPSGFVDPGTGKRYVVYKVDGNSIGNGGTCNNGIAPLKQTPIMLMEVGTDGFTTIGNPVQILDRTTADGPLVEAPSLIKTQDGSYVLFFSSGCFTTSSYDVKYAVAKSVAGPYVRADDALLMTGNFGTTAPGGATANDVGNMVFHANCPSGRCMYTGNFSLMGANVIIS